MRVCRVPECRNLKAMLEEDILCGLDLLSRDEVDELMQENLLQSL